MNEFINNNIKVICHGFTGKMGTYHSKLSMDYGTNIIGGISPGKGGSIHLNKPVFDNVFDAISVTKANVSIIFVPAKNCKDSILEAVHAGIKFIVCITEGVPVLDMLFLKKIFKERNIFFIGPNSPGLVVPGFCRLGIMPVDIHKSGIVGIVSRSGTLTYEAINQTSKYGLGQSVSIGIGGDSIVGSDFVDILKHLNKCDKTKAILLIGEIGGSLEEVAANFIKHEVKKPVFVYIAGVSAPLGKRMGHAGAIIKSKSGHAVNKIDILRDNGAIIINSIHNIGATIFNFFYKQK